MSKFILIADEDEWGCWQINIFLKETGFDLIFADDAGNAFELFMKYRPHASLIDIDIHSHDGLWLTEAILGVDHKSVIYLTSDQPLAKMRAVRRNLAVASIFEKPLDFDRLKAMLKS